MKGKACVDDFQAQDSIKKKKKKRKHNEFNENHENDKTVEDPELGCASPLLFEDAAAQGEEGTKKKKKRKKKDKKQQASTDNYFARWEHEISNGNGVAASPKKKRKQKGNDSTGELSDATCIPVNQDCQDSTADCVYFKKPKKKKKEKRREVDEACEVPPSEKHSKGNKEKSKKKKKKKRREGSAQEGTDGAAEQSLLASSEQSTGHRTCPPPAEEDGDCDAASGTSEVSMAVPADISTPSKAAGRAKKTPARAKNKYKSSAIVMEESSSESDVSIRTPKPSASDKNKKQKEQNSSFYELAASDEISVDGEEGLDFTVCSFMDLDTARQQLEEFIPHAKNLSDNSIKQMAGRDLTRFKEFKKQGIAVRFGRFTQKENKQIQKNVEEFLSLTGVDSAEKFLFTSRYPEEKDTINRLKIQHHFCEKISEGIPRPWRLIYYRARKMFDPNNYKGRYTKEEKEQLKKYQALHGNDWKKISELMSRSNLSVAMKFSEIKSAINYGPWTKEETQRLMNAVKEVMKRRLEAENRNSPASLEQSSTDLWIDREKLCQPLSWTQIETKVGSRYWRQCKQKWNSVLAKRMSQGQRHRGTSELQVKINLIKRLYETKAEDASEINWDELSHAIGDVPRTYIQAKFYKLKVSSVPLWQRKTFSEIIEFLHEKKLPELEEKLEKMEKQHHSSGNSAGSEQQKAFRFSDIFDSSEESD